MECLKDGCLWMSCWLFSSFKLRWTEMAWVGRTWDDLIVYANRKDKWRLTRFTDAIITCMEASQDIFEAIFVLRGIIVVFHFRCAFKVSGGNVFLFEWFYAWKHVQTLHFKIDFSLSGYSGRSDELAVPSHREAMADLLVFNSAI